MDFSDKLKKLRKDNKLSQEDLAQKLNVSRQAISKWELGTIPDIDNLVRISKYFDVSLDFLVSQDQSETKEIPIGNTPLNNYVKNLGGNIEINFSKVLNIINIITFIFTILIFILSRVSKLPLTRYIESTSSYLVGFAGAVDYYGLFPIFTILLIFWCFSLIFNFIQFKRKYNYYSTNMFNLILLLNFQIFVFSNLYFSTQVDNLLLFIILNFTILLIISAKLKIERKVEK